MCTGDTLCPQECPLSPRFWWGSSAMECLQHVVYQQNTIHDSRSPEVPSAMSRIRSRRAHVLQCQGDCLFPAAICLLPSQISRQMLKTKQNNPAYVIWMKCGTVPWWGWEKWHGLLRKRKQKWKHHEQRTGSQTLLTDGGEKWHT
jgi:hypothetical protein